MFDEKETVVIVRALTIAIYQLEKLPEDQRPDLEDMRELLQRVSPEGVALFFLQASLLFDPPKTPEDALARHEHYGIHTTIEDMRELYSPRN